MRDRGLELQVAKFNSFTRDLARRARADLPTVIRHEAGKIMEKTARLQTRATMQSLEESARTRPPWRTFRGVPKKDASTSDRLLITRKYPDWKWNFMRANFHDGPSGESVLRMNLAASTWLDMSRKLLDQVRKPPKWNEPKKPVGWSKQTIVMENLDMDRFFVMILNFSSAVRLSGGSQALFTAIAGRRRFFERNLRMGVFKTAEATAKKYPGITVSK